MRRPRGWLAASLMALFGCGEAPLGHDATSSTSSGAGGSGGTGGASSASSSGGTGGAGGCDQTLLGGPAASPYPFTIGGQEAWSHDDGFSAGYVHTFDALDVGGSAPHKVHVLVPAGYGPCDAGYPVIYMNDGSTAFWPGGPGNKTWDVPGALAGLYAEGSIPRVIVVAIEPNDRDYEYSHTPGEPGAPCCGAGEYTAYVADHVKPFIDGAYRTKPGRESTFIAGSSRGGLASFYVATRRPDTFGGAVCMSSSFWFGLDAVFGGNYPGGPLATSALVAPVAATLGGSPRPRFWIDWGLVRTGGFHNEVIEEAATVRGKEMVSLLQSTYGYTNGVDLFWEEDPMGEHDETSWGRRLPGALVAMLGP